MHAAIELAEEAHTRLSVSEAEAGTGLIGRIGRRRGNHRCWRAP